MINHLEPIDMAMMRAMDDGAQTTLNRFNILPEKDAMVDLLARSHRVRIALINHGAYKNKKGGENKK